MQSWTEITHDLQQNWYIYALMPVLAALIGWATKIVAIKMMFRPYVRRGLGPLSWQGIIPRRAPQMVDVLCDTLTGRLISSEEIVDRIDGDELARLIQRPLRKTVGKIAPKVAREYQPTVWNLLPRAGRDAIVQRAQQVAPDVVPEIVDALRDHIDDVFDLRAMVTAEFMADPDVLERMFLDVGRREFAFIRRSGLVFGFMIGIVQAAAWAAFQNPWVMPLFGLFTGWFTDWAALRLIFTPQEPKRYLGIVTWQGLFLKHRIPVSEEYGALIANRVLTSDRLVAAIFTGPRSQQVAELIAPIIERRLRAEITHLDRHVRREFKRLDLPTPEALDEVGTVAGSMLGAVTGLVGAPLRAAGEVGLTRSAVDQMALAAALELTARMPQVLSGAIDHLDDRLGIADMMSTKMVAMTPAEFESVLRPAFQADERTLIAVGAILGFLVGELQVQLIEHLAH